MGSLLHFYEFGKLFWGDKALILTRNLKREAFRFNFIDFDVIKIAELSNKVQCTLLLSSAIF